MQFQEFNAEKELQKSNRARSKTRNFVQILQKKLHMQMTSKRRLFRICLVSIIFLPILIIIQHFGDSKVVPKQIFDHITIDNLDKMHSDLAYIRNTSSFNFVERIAFTPNALPLESIIAMAVKELKLEGYLGVDTRSQLEFMVQDEYYMAGVLFNVDGPNITTLPSKLDFTLSFPPTLRTCPQKLWPTLNRYSGLTVLVTGKPVNQSIKDSNYGDVPPGYIHEGFVGLQHAISMAYIKLVSHLSIAELPKIYMSRYPQKRYIYDPLFVVIKMLLPIALMFTYSYSSYKMVFFITDETELGIMKALKVQWLNFFAWFVVLFLLQFFITLLSLFILSCCGWGQNVFQYSDSMTILCFMLAYLLANITFTLMICCIVVYKSRSAITVLVVHLLTAVPFPFIFVRYYDLSILPKTLFCLILNTGLGIGLNIILDFERTAEGLQWDNFSYPHFAGSNFTLQHVVTILLLTSVIHILIAIYVEGRRGENDVASKYVDVEARPVPWYYPCISLLNRRKKKKEVKILSNTILTKDRSTSMDAMPRIESLSSDVDIAVYQKYQRSNKPIQLEPPKETTIYPTTIIRPNKSQSSSSLSQESSDLNSSFSSYEISIDGYSAVYVNPVENVDLANITEGISVINVSKSFEGIEYLSNITMTIHPKEVTVILGQRGGGKMLLSEIIAGRVKMTSGFVVVNGKNVSEYKSGQNFDQPFAIMPKHVITFPLLTVRENLYFYTYLRGMRNHRQIAREIRKYSVKLDIQELMNTPVSDLQYGMNRCLSFCCVMCGGNHGIILDEPTLGLNENGCHRMWDMIKMEGSERTIIVCTQRHEEAVILADRIAVLDWGRLQCYGETQHLLKTFCSDYFLNCEKKNNRKYSKKNNALAMMNRYVRSGLEVRVDSRKQLCVRISDGNEIGLGLILEELEHDPGTHNIQSFTLFRKTLRDVFIENNTRRPYLRNSVVAKILEFEPEKGRRLRWQIKAILFKKLIYLKKGVLLPLFLLFLFTLAIIFEISPQGTEFIHLPKRNISLCDYKNSHVLSRENANLRPSMISHKLATTYKKYIEDSAKDCENHHHVIKGRREFIPYILGKQQLSYLRVQTFFAAAADFYQDKIICFWNPKLLHSAPISLNLLHNAVLQFVTNSTNVSINLANHPVKFTYSDFLNLHTMQNDMHLNIGIIPFLIFFSMVSLYAFHHIYELTSGGMMLELLSGVSHQLYWRTKFIWDMTIYNIMIIAILVIIVVNDIATSTRHYKQYSNVSIVALMLLILEAFGLAVLPFIYCLSVLFENRLFGYLVTLFILTGTSLLLIVITPGIERVLDIIMPDITQYLMYWSPSAVLVQCMRRLHILGTIKYSSDEMCAFCASSSIQRISFFSFEYPGILLLLFMLIVLAIIYGMLFNKISQSIVVRTWIKYCNYSRGKKPNKERVQIKEYKDLRVIALKFEDVVHPTHLKGVSFAIKHGEIFGIVGRFGSGKTKILEITAGRDIIESGDVYVYGKSVRYNQKEAFKYLGYCPKQNALHEFLTVKELLYFYCCLSGRKTKETNDLTEWLVTSLGLVDKLNVHISDLVFSHRRKLSLAVAVISSTKVVMIDEPTRGIGPEGRQIISEMINLIQKMGRTVVLAMESIEECMPLCDRICILVNGRLECIGSVDYLTQKFSRGCILQIYTHSPYETRVDLENAHLLSTSDVSCRMGQQRTGESSVRQSYEDNNITTDELHTEIFENSESQGSSNDEEVFDSWERKIFRYNDIIEFMEMELPYALLEEKYSNMLVYYIPFNMLPLSQVFAFMEVVKNLLNVSHYMIWRPSIVDMYEHFSKQNCRHWGKSTLLNSNCSSLASLVRGISRTKLRTMSKFDRIKRFFRIRKKINCVEL